VTALDTAGSVESVCADVLVWDIETMELSFESEAVDVARYGNLVKHLRNADSPGYVQPRRLAHELAFAAEPS
jgi:hypothetical protein